MNIDNKTSTEPEASPPPSPPVPRGPRLRVMLPVAAIVVAALAAGIIWSQDLKAIGHRVLEAVSPRPSEEDAQTAGPKQYYTCGMHPWVILPKPGDCPICHMKLIPLDPAKFTGGVSINPLIAQDIGVRVTPAVAGPVTQVIRTVGNVDYDETRVGDVNLKISGWVQKLLVNYTGQPVEKDQPLLEIYSPDLYSAQEEYLLAYRRQKELQRPGADPASAAANADLLESARKKLEYLDISVEQIRDLEKADRPSKTMLIRSPFRGIVVQKNVYEGQQVEAGMHLLRLADLSKLWVMATIYEYQLPFVAVGQKATVSLTYLPGPGQTFEAKVTYIYPYLNQKLRQATVRLELDNPDLLLKPGMFATVELKRTLPGDRVLVPREAVIDTGERQVAYVSLGRGQFDPRQVRMGVESEGGLIEITSGLKPGEWVVTSGEFLLDSESRLREALAKMIKGTPAPEEAVASPAATPASPAPPAAATGRFINARCPILGTPIDPTAVPDNLIRRYKGYEVAFCCAGCPEQWDKLTDAQKDEKLIKAGVAPSRLQAPAQPATAPKAGAMPPMPGMPGM